MTSTGSSSPGANPQARTLSGQRDRTRNRSLALAGKAWIFAAVAMTSAGAAPPVPGPSSQPYADERALSPDFETRLAADLDAIFHTRQPGRAPSGLGSRQLPSRSLTMLLRELRLNFDRLSPATRAHYGGLLARPSVATDPDYVTWGLPGTYTESTVSSSQFVVHYVSAPHDNPSTATTAFATQALLTLEEVSVAENGTLGWPPPPSDSFYPPTRNNGGDGRYDVYLADIGSIPGNPLFGYVAPEEPVPGAPGVASTSYMVLDNDYSPLQYNQVPDPIAVMRVTVAHEFNHSCQFGLDANDPEDWFYESTATHLEDQVYNSVNDYYRFLPAFFDWPEIALRYYPVTTPDPNNLHPYGATVWNHYLAARFGTALEVQAWTDTATGGGSHPTLWQTMETRLNGLGTSLPDEFGRFAAWNYLTGSRGDPVFYPEGAGWPEVFVPTAQKHASYPAAGSIAPTDGPEPLGASYVSLLPPPGGVGRLTFDFQGQGPGPWRLWWVGRKGMTTLLTPVSLDSSSHALETIDDVQLYSWIAFAASNVSTTGPLSTRAPFTYQATFENTLGASDLWLLAP